MNKIITISLQDYVKRLWNHSNTKIPITIGKGTDTAKPRSKAPQGGAIRFVLRKHIQFLAIVGEKWVFIIMSILEKTD